MRRHWAVRLAAWIAGGLGGLLVLLAILWFGYGLYVRWIVTRWPSTTPIIHTDAGDQRLGAYEHGNQIVTVAQDPRPTPSFVPPTPVTETRVESPAVVPAATRVPAPARAILPPTRLRIPKIGVNAPVVLADDDDLPRFKGIGWYIGSGYPGFRGNVVLFGHLNGRFETFARLNELANGDTVTIEAMNRTYQYSVTSSKTVPENAVAVMAPTRDYRVTLITCTGTFLPLTRDYTDRLVVVASLVEQ